MKGSFRGSFTGSLKGSCRGSFRGSFKGSLKGSIGSLEFGVLGGSWVVINGRTSPLIWVISIVTLLKTLLITTHDP